MQAWGSLSSCRPTVQEFLGRGQEYGVHPPSCPSLPVAYSLHLSALGLVCCLVKG